MGGDRKPPDEHDLGDDAPSGPPPHPDDRLWRHPAEFAATQRRALTTASKPLIAFVATLAALTGAAAVGLAWVSTELISHDGGAKDTELLALEPATLRPEAVNAEDWAEHVTAQSSPAVALLTLRTDGESSQASAVAFRGKGFLMTAADNIADADDVAVELPDGRQFDARVVAADPHSNIGVLQINDDDIRVAPLRIFSNVNPGQYAAVIAGDGHITGINEAGNLSAIVTAVDVHALDSDGTHFFGLLELGMTLESHQAGAAVVDETGAVIGITLDMGTRNVSYAVPISYAHRVATNLIQTGDAQHPWLGLVPKDLDPGVANALGLPGAAEVQEVVHAGPAALAGLQAGDVIVGINLEAVTSWGDLMVELREHVPATTITLHYLRNGTPRHTPITLGHRQ